jgi:PPM family protein phosphatase
VTLNLRAAGRTHMGLVRARNEDALYVGRDLFIVADGLGGHAAGDIASSTAVAAASSADRTVEPAELADTLAQAVFRADDAIRRRLRTDPGAAGMGTTMVALLHAGDDVALANIGDSRIYLRRDGRTNQVTEDHTYANLVARAHAVPTLAERIARYLDGGADGRSPDITRWRLQPGDRFLLCSDGLSSYVPGDKLEAILAEPVAAEAVAEALVAAALEHGGPDNVTVIVLDVIDDAMPLAA